MSKTFWCIAVNGLWEQIFGNPLSQAANFLNANTPSGVHFNVIGAADPRPYIYQYESNLMAAVAAGFTPILIGHSLGAMMMFYLADAAKKRGANLPLVVSYDSTDWGTNAPGTVPYSEGNPTAGQYFVPDNVDRWIHYRQPVFPGGGVAQLAPGNTHTKFENYERSEAHVWIPIIPDIEHHVLSAVLEVVKS